MNKTITVSGSCSEDESPAPAILTFTTEMSTNTSLDIKILTLFEQDSLHILTRISIVWPLSLLRKKELFEHLSTEIRKWTGKGFSSAEFKKVIKMMAQEYRETESRQVYGENLESWHHRIKLLNPRNEEEISNLYVSVYDDQDMINI
jgi:hypothetical protein